MIKIIITVGIIMNKQKGFTLTAGLLMVLIISVVGFAGYYVWNNQKGDEIITNSTQINSDTEQQVELKPTANTETNNWYGNEEGIITLTEFSDFQCPACGRFYTIISQIKEDFKDKIRFEFKHFPLENIHPNALIAHKASQAAANQGKFWEMHNLLYEQQQSWSQLDDPSNVFKEFATKLNLDVEQYEVDVNSNEVLTAINTDITEGDALRISSTPTLLIDGEKIQDLSSISTFIGFSNLIQDKIDAKKAQYE